MHFNAYSFIFMYILCVESYMKIVSIVFWYIVLFIYTLRGRDRIVVGFTTTCPNQCLSPLMLWVRISIRARCTTLCDKVCQWLATDQWFSPGPPCSSINETDRYDKTEILLKVAANTIKKQQQKPSLKITVWSGYFINLTESSNINCVLSNLLFIMPYARLTVLQSDSVTTRITHTKLS